MAHNDAAMFRIWPHEFKMVWCIHCATTCSFKSASRHRRLCLERQEQKKQIKKQKKIDQKMRRLLRMLETDTTELATDRTVRQCVQSMGRYVDPSEIAEGSQVHVRCVIRSLGRQWLRKDFSHIEQLIMTFLPSNYVY